MYPVQFVMQCTTAKTNDLYGDPTHPCVVTKQFHAMHMAVSSHQPLLTDSPDCPALHIEAAFIVQLTQNCMGLVQGR